MENFTILRTYNNPIDAEIDLARLQDEELRVYMRDSNMSNLMPHYALAVGGIKIFIHKDDFEKGSEVISYDMNHEADVDKIFDIENDTSDLVCPRCESPNIFQEKSIILGLIFIITLGVPFSVGKYIYPLFKMRLSLEKRRIMLLSSISSGY